MRTKISYEDVIGGYIIKEIDIETQDKIQLLEDGVDVEEIMKDDFRILKILLYKDVERKKTFINVEGIRRLLNAIDSYIDESIEFIKKKIEERREDENQFNEAFRRNAKGKRFNR